MIRAQLVETLNQIQASNSQCCISLSIPLETGFANNKKNSLSIKNAIKEAKEKLEIFSEITDTNIKKQALKNLEEFSENYEFHAGGGTFLAYISENFWTFFQVPFQVKRKVIVDDTFEVKDVIFTVNRLTTYYVLQLSLNGSILYYGIEDKLTREPTFIQERFKDTFEGKTPMSVYQSFVRGGDDTKKSTEAKKLYFKRLAEALQKHLELDRTTPIFVLGTEKNIGYFRNETKLGKQIARWIPGNYEKLSEGQLSQIVRPEVISWLEERRKYFLEEQVSKAIASQKFHTGIRDVWKASLDYNVFVLGVEKKFLQKAYTLRANPYEIFLEEPADFRENSDKYDIHPDLVDDIIEKVLSKKNTEVVFVEPDALKDKERIVAITHY